MDNKADVDTFCIDHCGAFVPLVNVTQNDDELEPAELADTLACRRILFEAGADPSLHVYEGFDPCAAAICNAVEAATFVRLDQIPPLPQMLTVGRNPSKSSLT